MQETDPHANSDSLYSEPINRVRTYVPNAGTLPIRECSTEVYRPLRGLGFYFALAYVFIVFTQLHELIMMAVGVNTFLLSIITVPTFLLLLACGGLQRALRWPAAKCWVGFTLLMIISVPFSTWRGESLWITISWIRAGLPLLFVIAGLVITFREFARLMTIFAWAAVVDVFAGRALAAQILGRLELSGTSVRDPNDYSAQLILLLPFLLFVILSPWRRLITRVAAAGILLYGLFLILSTGSRGGLIALIAASLFCIWKFGFRQKIMTVLIVVILALGAITVMPESILFRFSTVFSNSGARNADENSMAAIGSKEARLYLLEQSILATLSHPLFGVGPGEFQNYEGKKARELNQPGVWHQTHNSFTQVSSEIGIPAVLFYVAAIIATYRMLDRVHRRAGQRPPTLRIQRIKLAAFCLLLSLTGFCAASLFLSLAYRFYLPALTGLAIVLTRAVKNEQGTAVSTGAGLAPSLSNSLP